MAVYNGEACIREKVKSVLESDYNGKIHFLIGSDASTDQTNTILKELAIQYPGLLHPHFVADRQGKIRIINQLASIVKSRAGVGDILISTDATAIFDKDCIRLLVRHFNDQRVAAVGANIIKQKMRKDGISGQEKAYYNRELLMKYEEGLIWGTSIGVFGACYAIRPEKFPMVPETYLVDDFFITMHLLTKGDHVRYDLDAIVYMNLANETAIEFKRKIRIATGNFQNLIHFPGALFGLTGMNFAYWSHKVLRWFTPFCMIATYVTAYRLSDDHWIYMLAWVVQSVLFLIPFGDYLLGRMRIHHRVLRFIAHFYLMNLGILIGFFRFLAGVKNSVWEPTRR